LSSAQADQYDGMSILTMVLHRLARIIEYATPRYDVTLYLDDDMYACPGVEPLLGAALCGNQNCVRAARSVDLHAIDATPARWRGDVGFSPLDGASAATSS
jgi:hypothetical protein